MSSPARGSRTPRRTNPDTPTRRSTRRTPGGGSQTPTRDEDPSRTPRGHRTPSKNKRTANSDTEGTPMRWEAPRDRQDGSDLPATSPAPHIIPTSPAARKYFFKI